MQDFIIENGILLQYCGNDETVRIPDGVVEIGDEAFVPNRSGSLLTRLSPELSSVLDYMTQLHEDAARKAGAKPKEAQGVMHVTIPDSVVRIGARAFARCSNLQDIVIGSSVACIDYAAFSGCSSLERLDLPEGITQLAPYLCCNCRKLKQVHMPQSVTAIGRGAFDSCSSLRQIHLPSNLQQIDEAAFAHTYLQQISVSDNPVYTVQDGMLIDKQRNAVIAASTSLTEAIVPDGIRCIAQGAFGSCSELTDLKLPESLETIESQAFRGCCSLRAVDIPNHVTKIGYHAFQDCDALAQITLGKGLTQIDDFAFAQCSGLKSVTIPENVMEIGRHGFESCENLTHVTILGDAAEYGVIKEKAFENCSKLGHVHIVNGMWHIEDQAFYGCGFRDITLPRDVHRFGKAVFGPYSVTIHAPAGSEAENYAKRNQLPFAIIE